MSKTKPRPVPYTPSLALMVEQLTADHDQLKAQFRQVLASSLEMNQALRAAAEAVAIFDRRFAEIERRLSALEQR